MNIYRTRIRTDTKTRPMSDVNTQEYQTDELVQEEETRRQWLLKKPVVDTSRFWMIRIMVSNDSTDLDLERLRNTPGCINYMLVAREIGSEEGCDRLQGYIQFQKKYSKEQVTTMVRYCNFFNYSTNDPTEIVKFLKQNGDYNEYGHLIKIALVSVQ